MNAHHIRQVVFQNDDIAIGIHCSVPRKDYNTLRPTAPLKQPQIMTDAGCLTVLTVYAGSTLLMNEGRWMH